jgi:hypothetical protein
MSMTNFVIYLIGTLLVVAGLAYGASRMGVSQVWIIAGALVIIGIGLMGRNREDASEGSGVVLGDSGLGTRNSDPEQGFGWESTPGSNVTVRAALAL